MHHATPYIKYILDAGGGEEFVRIPARAALFSAFPSPPSCRTASMQSSSTNPPLPTTHVFAFQRDVSLNARIAPGLTTLPEGEPVLSGPAAALRALREEGGRGGGKRSDTRRPAAPKLAKNRLRLSFHEIDAISLRFLQRERERHPMYLIKIAFVIAGNPGGVKDK